MPARIGYPADLSADDIELLVDARERFAAGRTYRQSKREESWRQSERQYEGKHWESTRVDDPTADLITINASFSTVNTIMPYITGEEPSFLVQPYSKDASVANARLQQALLNRIWTAQRTGAQPSLEEAATNYLIYGDGFLKILWHLGEKQVATDQFVDVADIKVDSIDPWNFWIDPTARGIHDARWVCERIVTTKRELEKERYIDEQGEDRPVYANLDLVEAGRIDIEAENADLVTTLGTRADDYVILYEFYDMVDDYMLAFVESGEMPLRKVEGITPPIVQMGNYRLPRSPYHMGELEQIWPMQQELNKSRSQLITHRRRNTLKYLVRENAIGTETAAALQSPVVGELVPILGEVPLDDIIQPVNLQPMMPDAYNSADQAMRDIYEITGVNEYLRGATPEIRRTATEASIIEGASNVKTAAKLRSVERAVRAAGELVLAVAEDVFPLTAVDEMGFFITGEEAQRVNRAVIGEEVLALQDQGDEVGADALLQDAPRYTEAEITPNAAMFVGEYEVLVESGSTELRNPIFREQKARELATALIEMSPVLAQQGIQLNLRKALESWFEAAGITDVEGMFAGGSTPGPQVAPLPGPGSPPIGPNLQSAQPPVDALTAANTGAIPVA